VNDYDKIQKIYESSLHEGYQGQAFDPIQPSNYYPAKQDWGPYSRPVPGTPEASGYSQFRKNQVGNNIAVVVDEEIEAAEIINLDVLDKLEELIDESDDAGMEYAVLQLSKLKEHIICLSQGKRD
jgi:hypothetical protein